MCSSVCVRVLRCMYDCVCTLNDCNIVWQRITLQELQGTFEIPDDNIVVLKHLRTLEFEEGVSEAVQSAMALKGYEQVVHELTLLQLFCRANKAC